MSQQYGFPTAESEPRDIPLLTSKLEKKASGIGLK